MAESRFIVRGVTADTIGPLNLELAPGDCIGLTGPSQNAWRDAAVIETRLALGASAAVAIADIRREAMRTGMIPMLNAMAAAGVISLPGMMTGQILAGSRRGRPSSIRS